MVTFNLCFLGLVYIVVLFLCSFKMNKHNAAVSNSLRFVSCYRIIQFSSDIQKYKKIKGSSERKVDHIKNNLTIFKKINFLPSKFYRACRKGKSILLNETLPIFRYSKIRFFSDMYDLLYRQYKSRAQFQIYINRNIL